MVEQVTLRYGRFDGAVVDVPNFLKGDFGFAALLEYSSIVKSDFQDNRLLDSPTLQDNLIVGRFNFYSSVLMNSRVLKQSGLRMLSPAEAGQILLNGGFCDNCLTALVLRPYEWDDTNKLLADDVAKQVRARGRGFSHECPLMIPLIGLELKKDSGLPGGLGFRLLEDCELIDAPQLCGINHGSSFRDIDQNGLPIFYEPKPKNYLMAFFNRAGKSGQDVKTHECFTSLSDLTGIAFSRNGHMYATQTSLDFSPHSNYLFYTKDNS